MSRKSLRKKITEILKDANIPGIEKDVFNQRSVPTAHDTLPLILIYTRSESVDRRDEAPKSYDRNLSVTLEILATNDNDELLADDLDDLADLVEDAMERSDKADDLFNMVNDYELVNVSYEVEGTGDAPIGKAQLDYDLQRTTDESKSPDSLPNFKRLKTIYKVNGQESDDAQETITLDTSKET